VLNATLRRRSGGGNAQWKYPLRISAVLKCSSVLAGQYRSGSIYPSPTYISVSTRVVSGATQDLETKQTPRPDWLWGPPRPLFNSFPAGVCSWPLASI